MDDRDGRRQVLDLVSRFTAAHFAAHPEEASSLGAPGYQARLGSPSREVAASELASLRSAMAEGDAIEEQQRRGALPLDLDLRLDLDALFRAARGRARRIERDLDAEVLEPATLPHSALQRDALGVRTLADVEALTERARAVPGYLEAHADNLRRGVAEGRGADHDIASTFVERILPGAARSLETLVSEVGGRVASVAGDPSRVLAPLAEALREASMAYRKLSQVVADEILPHARRDVVLGEEETAFRLRDVMGVDTPIDELVAAAQRRLARAHAEIVEHARASGNAGIHCVTDAREVVLSLFEPKPGTIDQALAAYRMQLDAATRFCRERAIVEIPDDLALALEPLPEGIADGAGLTNWPAPLLDPAGRGFALYSPDPSAHPTIMAKQLAIHEGIPGHYLQSAMWQRSPPRPVRFFGVADDVAMAAGTFGTMVSVEGWAVHMEEVMVREGFMEPGRELLFSAWCDAVRAMRVILDLELHARDASADEMTARVADATLLEEGWARQQVLRSKRIPLQSSTYLIGAMEIEALEALARPSMSQLDFHRRLLSYGPVPTSRLRSEFGG